MTRLILVLDEKSGLPVWYDIIPGNVLDINTVMAVVNDVADSLGIEIESWCSMRVMYLKSWLALSTSARRKRS